jgi:hypothetical protein
VVVDASCSTEALTLMPKVAFGAWRMIRWSDGQEIVIVADAACDWRHDERFHDRTGKNRG